MKPAQSWRISSVLGAIALAAFTCLVLQWSQPILAQSNKLPRQRVEWAYPTNYGERVSQDAYGTPLHNPLIVVIHETVGSAESAVNTFKVPNYSGEGNQVSYHALIALDGTVIHTVPFKYRAFGAGNSVFTGGSGPETVQTNAKVPASVNNFAYHFSLETPADGRNNADRHSGYTVAQYQSLAWLVRYTKVPEARITYHKTVDRTGTRRDPRSFNRERFLQSLRAQQAARQPSIDKLAYSDKVQFGSHPPT
ncbi:N-acetylmuramoyl-L-alanine amidase [Altericista sp. CCNU0014]|uniref:N-acetylmuramoyl-L-alanine amidase n=1 Tax=Altericista sp. CCNU0014 TaxID=3082949 RepID=UPI00384FDA8D